MENQKVKFVRIKGRVVPIKVKGSFNPKKQKKPKPMAKETKFALQSAGFTIAGLGASIASGRKSTSLFKRADKIHQMSFDFAMDKNFSRLPKGIKSSSEGMIKAGKMIKRSKQLRSLGQIAGGAMLSQGVQRALRSQGIEIDNPVIDVGAEAGSQLASHLIARESRKAFGSAKKKFSVKMPSGLSKVAKDIGTRFIKKQLRFKF
jgi:hypothetical protein